MSLHGRTVINAEGLILGRMASIVAKRLLDGERIEIVNAEKAVVSGRRDMVLRERVEFLGVGKSGRKGPIHYRRPSAIVRRTVRGMLPHRKARGREAFRRLRVHIGVPRDLEVAQAESLPDASLDRLRGRYVTVAEIARRIGWKDLLKVSEGE